MGYLTPCDRDKLHLLQNFGMLPHCEALAWLHFPSAINMTHNCAVSGHMEQS